MAKLEIPSIVVQHNGPGCGGEEQMNPLISRFRRKRSSHTSLDNLENSELETVEEFICGCPSNEDQSCTCVMEKDDDLPDVGSGRSDSEPNQCCADSSSGHDDGTASAAAQLRTKNSSKAKLLVRSHAIREATSPPPDPAFRVSPSVEPRSEADVPGTPQNAGRRSRVKQASSGQSSMESSVSFSLSRDACGDVVYTDNTGVDLLHFIIETLHRNNKDRLTLLRIEQEMVDLVEDPQRTFHKFPSMSSYHRMLVHRVAAYFGMEHNVDQTGTSVVVSKSRHTRLPDRRFVEYVREDLVLPEEPIRKSILKRDALSFEDFAGSRRYRSPERRSKSFEEREEDYIRVRHRVFQPQMSWNSSQEGAVSESAYASAASHRSSQEELGWPAASTTGKRHGQGAPRSGRVPKVESFDSRELLSGYGNVLRPTVAKSYSFGGYTAPPAAAESVLRPSETVSAMTRPHAPAQRALAKQDSASSCVSVSRLSPTSSGYKSQQSQSVSAATSPTPVAVSQTRPRLTSAAQATPEVQSAPQPPDWTHNAPETVADEANAVTTAPPGNATANSCMWVVTSLDAVPPGSILINPQTGQPFYNADGTVYRYDPSQPLPFSGPAVSTPRDELASLELQQTYTGDAVEDAAKQAVDSAAYGCENSSIPAPCPPWPSYALYESTGATPTPVATPTPYAGPVIGAGQPYYADYGCYVFPQPGDASELSTSGQQPFKALAVPVAYGQGYVLYHLAPSLGDPSFSTDPGLGADAELNPLLKTLCLRPAVPVHGNPPAAVIPAELSAQPDLTQAPLYVGSPRSNGTPLKVVASVPQFVPANSYRPPYNGNGLQTVTMTSATPQPNLQASCGLVTQVSGGMYPPAYPCTASTPQYPYTYPVATQQAAPPAVVPAHPLPTTPHHFTPGVVHHYNNTQQVPSRPMVMRSPAPSRGRTPDRDVYAEHNLPRPMHVGIQHNRFPVIYGSQVATPMIPGDGRQYRHSAFFHRSHPFSMHASPAALLNARPRVTHQLGASGSWAPHQLNQAARNATPPATAAGRPPPSRRHSSKTMALNDASSSSASPVQNRLLNEKSSSRSSS